MIYLIFENYNSERSVLKMNKEKIIKYLEDRIEDLEMQRKHLELNNKRNSQQDRSMKNIVEALDGLESLKIFIRLKYADNVEGIESIKKKE